MAKIVTDFLDASAAKFPDKTAVVTENRKITYKDLQAESHHIAMGLINAGLSKKPVALFFDKGISCIEAFHGVAYSGNFYSLIDPEMPAARVEKILEVLDPEIIITDLAHKEDVDAVAGSIPVIYYEELLKNDIDAAAVERTKRATLGSDILYILFTSGSTGVPKGVVTPHRSVVSYINAVSEAYGIDDTLNYCNQAPFYFVMSVLDIYSTMRNSGTLHIVPKQYFSFPILLAEYIEKEKINYISWVPSILCIFANLKVFKEADLTSIKVVDFGGEVMPAKQLRIWRENLPDAKFINGYGMTECTDGSTYYVVNRDFADNESLPIGVPYPNASVFLVDDEGKETKEGIGELYIKSDAINYGYYKDPGKTAEVFVQNPLHNNYPDIVYKTGDLAHYNEFGELVYDGRKDFQIKHMGRRIELGEIEANVSAVSEITECCVLYNQKRKRIVLFYAGDIEKTELSKKLTAMLPDYMLPKSINQMDALPKNMNGKIDRKVLQGMA